MPAVSTVTTQKKRTKTTNGQANGQKNKGNGNGILVELFAPKPHFVPMDTGTELTDIRRDVFLDRYSLKDVDGSAMEMYPEQMWRRVAWGISQVEKPEKRTQWEEKFYASLQGFKFVPAGRILSGAGTGYEVTFYNCYVIPNPRDSRHGIMENVELTVEIQARGGGVGVNLSSLRPRGARVKKVNGTSSGPVNWASLYSTANHDVIQQGGSRRGALMLMLNDWHPDLEEFITVKEDLSKIPGANLSVCVSDAFMEAVRTDSQWQLVFPDLDTPGYDELWDGDLEKWQERRLPVKTYKTARARDVWDLIAQAAWRSAEPGVVFIDRYNQMSNVGYCEKIISTNPCLTGDALVSTDKGLVSIKELVGKEVKVLTDGRLSKAPFKKAVKVIKTGQKSVYRLLTKEGYELDLTADHRVLTQKGWIESGKLKVGDKISVVNRKGGFGIVGSLDEGRVIGWLVGDGTMKATEAVLSFFGREKQQLAPLYAQMVNTVVSGMQISHRDYVVAPQFVDERDEARVASVRLHRYLESKGIKNGDKLQVPKSVLQGTEEMQSGFLQALFTADGHVSGTQEKGVSVRLTSIKYELLVNVQRLLLNFGIASKIYRDRRGEMERNLPDGKGGYKSYKCQAYHELVISKENLVSFAREIGFLVDYKNDRLLSLIRNYLRKPNKEEFQASFEKLVYLGVEDVYDLTEPVTHSFIANGLVVHNCGEQGLGAWGVCNLGHINLSPFVKGREFDYEGLREHVAVATRFLDNVVDANLYFAKENEDAQKYGIRRIGLGTLGLADALIKMGIRYGSGQSLDTIEKIYKVIRDTAYDTSSEISREKGPFGKFEKDKYLQGKFVEALPEEIRVKIKKYGIRNGILLTQAPTGTVSLLSGVSSGIEPVYEFTYRRNDRTGEHIVRHPLLEEWMSLHKGEEIPDYFVSASQLTPEEHVRVQAMVQKYTDASISKTVNAPNSHTVEDVKKLYDMAYELGCKGVTYFRDGSRAGVLSKVDEEQPTVEVGIQDQAPVKPRPLKAVGATYRLTTPLGSAFITINEDDNGEPLEVFVNVGKAGSDVKAMADGLGRVISASLRFRGNLSAHKRVAEIAEQLSGIGGRRSVGFGPDKIRSLPDAVAAALSMHFNLSINGNGKHPSWAEALGDKQVEEMTGADGSGAGRADGKISYNSSASFDLCPSCGASALVFEEGCAKCYECGHSEC